MISSKSVMAAALAVVIASAGAVALAQDQAPRMRTMVPEAVSQGEIVKSLTPVGVPEGTEVSVAAQVTFKFDSSELTPTARAFLDTIAAALNTEELEDYRFLIEGHTDAKGTTEYNQGLSERRAAAAFNYLVSRGVEIARLNAIGFGERHILPDTDPLDGLNRRVEIVRLP